MSGSFKILSIFLLDENSFRLVIYFLLYRGNLSEWFDAISIYLRYSARNRLWFAENILYPASLQLAQLAANKDKEKEKERDKEKERSSSFVASVGRKEKPISAYYRFAEYLLECPSHEVFSS